MKIIFFGTPNYVLPILEELHKNYKLVAVVTQPPKLVGRKQLREFSAVDNWAHARKIPVITSLSEKIPEAGLGIVAAYGLIIPQSIIDHFSSTGRSTSGRKYGILNIHPSLLPKYRGASPIQSQIIDGVTQTGVSIIKMDAKMDHGPIISQFKDEISDTDTNETLRLRLFQRSAQFLVDLLPNYLEKKINFKPQDEKEATFTKLMSKEDGFVDLKKDDPIQIERKFRALTPWPGIWTYVQLKDHSLQSTAKKHLKILKLHTVVSSLSTVSLVIDQVQLEGKKRVSFEEFKRGYPQIKL